MKERVSGGYIGGWFGRWGIITWRRRLNGRQDVNVWLLIIALRNVGQLG